MKLLGSINENGELLIRLSIIGFRGETVVDGILDTGFNGALLLPAAIIAELGTELLENCKIVIDYPSRQFFIEE
ncbi:MAG: hypothetical protein ONB46_03820 [candidate division KSB1 bacterium]|nr:hypothetical protein [candidate division KSB1 bacterium]MDZ7364951.1 hypothetical protein [candidate division KSB1 bacterium]MDZ7403346.1 hypothetical protein [candidate division KSB1 bacterium]